MAAKEFTPDTILVMIIHQEKGDGASGKAVCDKVRTMVAGGRNPICLFHDAMAMTTANAGYAGEFKLLDKDINDRLVEVVCAIPGSIPRMMAHTVAMFSDKDWSIFKTMPEALAYLYSKGYSLTEGDIARSADVSVWARK